MILVGVPCGDSIKTRTAFSLLALKGDFTVAFEIGADVANARNLLASRASGGGFSHILFVDSDMSFEPDTLQRMLAHDKDILGLAANRKRLPLESVVKPLNDDEVGGELPTQLFEAQSVGAGVLLVKSDVFRKIPAYWFDFEYLPEGERVSEDVRFCRLARDAGYKIWVDPTIPVQHIGDYPY